LPRKGVTGSISTAINGKSNLIVKWPNWGFIIGDDPELDFYNCSVSGNIDLSKSGSKTRIQGEITLVYSDETETSDLDVTLN
jgi:hypothetical protein